jgi:hypothetical protein
VHLVVIITKKCFDTLALPDYIWFCVLNTSLQDTVVLNHNHMTYSTLCSALEISPLSPSCEPLLAASAFCCLPFQSLNDTVRHAWLRFSTGLTLVKGYTAKFEILGVQCLEILVNICGVGRVNFFIAMKSAHRRSILS